MEKIAENDEEILYVNKNNPFGVERIREITKNLKGGDLEVDEENQKIQDGLKFIINFFVLFL